MVLHEQQRCLRRVDGRAALRLGGREDAVRPERRAARACVSPTMIRCARVGLARVAVGSALAADDVGMTFPRGFAPPGVAGVKAFADSARATMSFMV